MKFNLTPPWTNTQTIVDGQGTGDLISGANKINPNFNKINTFNTVIAGLVWTTVTANAITITINQVAIFANPSANATYTLPQISTMTGSERSFTIRNMSGFTITFAANATDKIKNPYTETDTGLGGTKTLIYAPGDELEFFPNTATATWIVTVVRENNMNIFARANLSATITNPGISSGNLPYNNRLDDPNNLYTPTLGNYNFTVPIPGDYTVEGNLFINGATVDTTKYTLVAASLNGTSISMGNMTNINTVNIVSSICFTIKKCAFGDKLSLTNQSTVATGSFIHNAAGLSLVQFRITQRYIP